MSPTPRNVEQAASSFESGASFEAYLPMPEQYEASRISPERIGQIATQERMPQMPAQQAAPLQSIAMPQVSPQPVQVATEVQPLQAPISANDDDTIEKEWVDRAKQIIAETRDNPRAREKAIGALQRDYLMKRYGKQLGATLD